MNNRKIVFLINSLDGGGAERVASTLLNSFVDRYECHLILMESKVSYELDERINIINLNEKLNQHGAIKLLRIPVVAYKLGGIIRQYEFNHIVSFLHRANYVNILSGSFASHKIIISERIASSSMYRDKSITSQVSKFLIKRLYKKSDLIISVSKSIENDLKSNFNIINKQVVIYNPYNLKKIRELSIEPIGFKIDKEKSIITVGSLEKRKNHSLLIESFSTIHAKTHTLYILGKGSEEQNLKKLTKELNIENRVIFLGFDNNPYKYLSKCNIFVLNSSSEGFPNVLAEAMICGCSVISTDCLSGPREILAPCSNFDFQLKDDVELAEYGILTPIENKNLLQKAMSLMVNNKELREKYSKMSKERAEDFNLNEISNKYLNIIQ